MALMFQKLGAGAFKNKIIRDNISKRCYRNMMNGIDYVHSIKGALPLIKYMVHQLAIIFLFRQTWHRQLRMQSSD